MTSHTSTTHSLNLKTGIKHTQTSTAQIQKHIKYNFTKAFHRDELELDRLYLRLLTGDLDRLRGGGVLLRGGGDLRL